MGQAVKKVSPAIPISYGPITKPNPAAIGYHRSKVGSVSGHFMIFYLLCVYFFRLSLPLLYEATPDQLRIHLPGNN